MMDNQDLSKTEHLQHVVSKISEILAGPLSDHAKWPEDRRWWLQLGYNLGRLSELTGSGRTVWDTWKPAVESADAESLQLLLRELNTWLKPEENEELI